MIERIDIPCFGSFKDFKWSASVLDTAGNQANFRKLNILYGKNYSGKTTLSRILRSLETGKLPEKYDSPAFSVVTSSSVLSSDALPSSMPGIRVYNRDFVDDYLAFLRDGEGKITPFAVIGRENKVLEGEIAKREAILGSADGRAGIRFEHTSVETEHEHALAELNAAEGSLHAKLVNKANQPPTGIKHNPLYKDVNYDVRKIKADLEVIRADSIEILSENEKRGKLLLLQESPIPDIEISLTFTPRIGELNKAARKLLSGKIQPSMPLQRLLDDAVLQAWVKEGIPHHRGKRTMCGFCGGRLSEDLWTQLEAHFSKESTDLEAELTDQIDAVNLEKRAASEITNVEETSFYSTFREEFVLMYRALANELRDYQEHLAHLTALLKARLQDIFTPLPVGELPDNSTEIAARIAEISDLIQRNNRRTQSLETDQANARRELRLNEVAQFARDIDLDGEQKKIDAIRVRVKQLQAQRDALDAQVHSVEKETEDLRRQLTDERRGAEKVNEYLNCHFGHEGLRLEAVADDDASTYRFQILRGNTPAYNLSEGECSLVAFCYFIAKLDDVDASGKDLTIFIDDPVSSLDSNHIFFVFSLIESRIAGPQKDSDGRVVKDATGRPQYRYDQLFISTHNLEFLKYLKRLSRPKKAVEQFVILCRGGKSTIELMPQYLRNYVTEFNHLFGEIYACIDPANATSNYHSFCAFGNNLRRFLEAYLFFKYPFSNSDQEDYNIRIHRFFGDVVGNEILVQRLTNEYSHLGGMFDRGVQPIDHAEISKLAAFVLRRIREKDREQFSSLLESIERPDPFE